MKNTILLCCLAFAVAINWQCATEPAGASINGQFTNAANLKMNIEKFNINGQTSPVGQTDIDADGNFTYTFPEGIENAAYKFTMGVRNMTLVFAGNEKDVNITGDLNSLPAYMLNIKGSEVASTYANTLNSIVTRKMDANKLQTFLKNEGHNPVMTAMLASQTMPSKQFITLHKTLNQTIQKEIPSSQYAKDYTAFITKLETQPTKSSASSGPIKIGQEAPDIALPSPDGKTYKLSDLKGQIVLLDFWASWCGPCRRENPHVVDVYKKYKQKGFTVYSVSLDGIDSRTKARYNNDQARIDQAMKSQKDRWVNAIKQDNLIWDTHVSDLKKWECAPARQYGVSGIPKTFLIDKDGKIAAINPRGAGVLEGAVKKLLAKS